MTRVTIHLQAEVVKFCANSLRHAVEVPQLMVDRIVAQWFRLANTNKHLFICCTILNFQQEAWY